MIILRKKVLVCSLVLLTVVAVATPFVGKRISATRADGGNCTVWSSIPSNFNGTPIPGGSFIWFTSVMKLRGLPPYETWMTFRNQQITFSANGTQYAVAVPDGEMDLNPAASSAIAWFANDQGVWQTTIPSNISGNMFLSAVEFQVPPGGFPGGINPVTWSGEFVFSPGTSITVNWQWAAAVYTYLSSDYNELEVKPVDDNHASQFSNSDHAGTPEAFKYKVIGGARGGGGSNFTGSLSATVSAACTSRTY